MQKSVYSLVLSDEVVSRIDRAAYAMKTNRSSLINRILAEYLSMSTPEMQVREVFEAVEALLGSSGSLRLLERQGEGQMALRSAIAYKYNPTARYQLELFGANPDFAGRLRVTLRTQNTALLEHATEFFTVWDELERRLLGESRCEIEPGRLTRTLMRPEDCAGESLGACIAGYIRLFDNALKHWFDRLGDPHAPRELAQSYREHLKSNPSI